MSGSTSGSSVINKHKSSSTSSMAASLNVALKSAIESGGANAGEAGGPGEPVVPYVPQPKLVEQLGWDEPEIKVAKRANFDDGTSIWGDPIDSVAVPVKKWTNGTKAALGNATNTVPQQAPSSAVQKPAPGSLSTPTSAQKGLTDENWPKQQSPTLTSQPLAQWNEATAASNEPVSSAAPSQQQQNYRTQQSANSNWNAPPQQSSHSGNDEWFRDGVVDTSDWGLQVDFSPILAHTSLSFSRTHRIKSPSIRTKAKSTRVIGQCQAAEEVVVVVAAAAVVWVDRCKCLRPVVIDTWMIMIWVKVPMILMVVTECQAMTVHQWMIPTERELILRIPSWVSVGYYRPQAILRCLLTCSHPLNFHLQRDQVHSIHRVGSFDRSIPTGFRHSPVPSWVRAAWSPRSSRRHHRCRIKRRTYHWRRNRVTCPCKPLKHQRLNSSSKEEEAEVVATAAEERIWTTVQFRLKLCNNFVLRSKPV